MASATHSRSSSTASDGAISLSRRTIDEPPPPHPNRLIPQPTNTNATATTAAKDATTRSSPRTSTAGDIESPSLSRTSSFQIDTSLHLTRISQPAHLKSLPSDFLSEDYSPTFTPEEVNDIKPLLHIDENGHEYKYFLEPMKKAVIFILVVEMLERFSFYGINYTTTAYLTGE